MTITATFFLFPHFGASFSKFGALKAHTLPHFWINIGVLCCVVSCCGALISQACYKCVYSCFRFLLSFSGYFLDKDSSTRTVRSKIVVYSTLSWFKSRLTFSLFLSLSLSFSSHLRKIHYFFLWYLTLSQTFCLLLFSIMMVSSQNFELSKASCTRFVNCVYVPSSLWHKTWQVFVIF